MSVGQNLFSSRVHDGTIAVPAAPSAPVTLVDLPELHAEGRPVLVLGTVRIEKNVGAAIDVKAMLFRDGAEISAEDAYSELLSTGTDREVLSLHWVDDAPGQSPVYSLRLSASATGASKVGRSRFTAHV